MGAGIHWQCSQKSHSEHRDRLCHGFFHTPMRKLLVGSVRIVGHSTLPGNATILKNYSRSQTDATHVEVNRMRQKPLERSHALNR